MFHNVQLQAAQLLQPTDERFACRTHDLVSSGVNPMSKMERCIHYYVKNDLFANERPLQASNRRFFSTSTDTRNHLYRAAVSCRHSKIDQENLAHKIKDWQHESPEDKFLFRPHCQITQLQHKDNCTHLGNIKHDDNDDDDKQRK